MAVLATLRPILCALLALAAFQPPAAAEPAGRERRIPGPDGAWDYLSFDEGRHRIYVSRSYGVMMIDTMTGRAVERFAEGDRSHAVVVIPDAEVLVVTNSGDSTARIIDARSGSSLASIPTGRGADAAVYDPASRRVWVMNHTDGTISVIDPLTRTADGLVQVGGILESAVVGRGGRLYVNVEDRDEIAVVDTTARRTIRRYRLRGCEPTGLALTGTGLLVAACDGKTMVVRATDGRRVAQFSIGHEADAVAYDPVRERVYIPTGADGRIWRLDVRDRVPRLMGSVAGAIGSRKAGVDPLSGDIFLPTAKWKPIKSPDDRPAMKAGTFSIHVLKATR